MGLRFSFGPLSEYNFTPICPLEPPACQIAESNPEVCGFISNQCA